MTRAFYEQTAESQGELPEGWAEVALGDLVVHALGGDWGEEAEEGEPEAGRVRVSVLRGTEFRLWEREKGATAAERVIKGGSFARRELKAGDLVIEISGGGPDQPVGRSLRVDEEALARAKNPLVCSNFCRQVRLHPEVDPAYVQLGLRYGYARGDFDRFQAQTTNLRNLSFPDFLAGVALPLPPLAEQRRIATRAAELLGRVDAARLRLERLPAILRRLRQAVLAAACSGRLTEDWRERMGAGLVPLSRPDAAEAVWEVPAPLEAPEVPAGWDLVPLRELVTRVQYGLSLKADGDARRGMPILRMANIRDGKLDLAQLKYLDREGKTLGAYGLARGDILFNRTNSPELVGKAAVFDVDLEAVFASYLVRLACDGRRVLAPWICGWINSPWGRWWARTVRTDGVSQSNISTSKLLAMPVPVPSLAEQREIVSRVEDLLATAERIEKRLAVATRTADRLSLSVLAGALRGELVATEAELARREGREYEPAWTLLDRIRADREAAGGGVTTRRRKAEPLSPAGETAPAARPPRLEEQTPEQILAAFRQACWGAGELPEIDLLRRVARRLGHRRLTRSIQVRLEEFLTLALARRIVAREGDLLVGATPNFGRYEQEFLLQALWSVLRKGVEYERLAVCRALAARLGYSQVTAAMRDRMEEIFGVAIRMGLLEARGSRIVRRG
jgi:type I restriction enzyme S subunit